MISRLYVDAADSESEVQLWTPRGPAAPGSSSGSDPPAPAFIQPALASSRRTRSIDRRPVRRRPSP